MTIKEDKHRFMFTIEKEVLEKFKKIAQKEGRSTSNLVAKLVRDYVEKNEN